MADIDLPVYSFTPNWADGIIETLEWRTDVLASYLGYEQRRKLRLTPRRFFEADFNPVGNVRSFMSLWLQRFAEQEMLLPLWHDKAKLTSDVAIGGTRIEFDNTFREFEADPGLALLRQSDFIYEVVSLSAQDDDGINLDAGTARAWPVGTVIYPVRPAVFDNPGETLSALTGTVGRAAFTFRCTRSNPYTAGDEVLGSYDGYPVVVKPPNREDPLRVRNARTHEDVDSVTGRVYRRDEAARAFAQQGHDWRAVGRQEHHELRQTLYRLAGRQKAVWLPTFNQDAIVASDVATGSGTITIGEIGYGFLGGPTSGRRHFFVEDTTGTPQIVEVTSAASAALSDGQEVLTLSANTTFDIAAGTPMSFVETMRLDQDAVEITHYTDSEGVCDAAAAFRGFRDGRTTSGNLIQPQVTAEKSANACGSPAEAEQSPCLRVFLGWHHKIVLAMPGNIQAIGSSSLIVWLNNEDGTTQYSGSFYTDGDGAFNPNRVSGNSHQFQRAADNSFVNLYIHNPKTDVREIRIRMQRLGGGSGSTPPFVNTLTFQDWNGSVQGPLATIQSVYISPGANSDEGNGLTEFPSAGGFPDDHYFGV